MCIYNVEKKLVQLDMAPAWRRFNIFTDGHNLRSHARLIEASKVQVVGGAYPNRKPWSGCFCMSDKEPTVKLERSLWGGRTVRAEHCGHGLYGYLSSSERYARSIAKKELKAVAWLNKSRFKSKYWTTTCTGVVLLDGPAAVSTRAHFYGATSKPQKVAAASKAILSVLYVSEEVPKVVYDALVKRYPFTHIERVSA